MQTRSGRSVSSSSNVSYQECNTATFNPTFPDEEKIALKTVMKNIMIILKIQYVVIISQQL